MVKLGPNIEVSGVPYDALLAGKYVLGSPDSSRAEQDPSSAAVYEKLDVEAKEQLLSILETFEQDLQDYIEMKQKMPQMIKQSFEENYRYVHFHHSSLFGYNDIRNLQRQSEIFFSYSR